MSEHTTTQHVHGESPRVLVVDGSRVVRELMDRVLKLELPDCVVKSCASGAEALAELEAGGVDLVTTALVLPDMDGVEFVRRVRAHVGQPHVPIIVVSADVEDRLISRTLSDDITDYFDKGQGYPALAAFVRGYVQPAAHASGRVLYVEDSRVVALATIRMLEKSGFSVTHVLTVEAALDELHEARDGRSPARIDLVLTDVNLNGALSGKDLLGSIRGEAFGYGKSVLPVLVMTGEQKSSDQAAIMRAGANDLVAKPIEERVLINKLMFQLGASRRARQRS